MYYIGLMSGTSVDAIDAVLVDFEQSSPRISHSYSKSIPVPLQQRLRRLGPDTTLSEILTLDVQLGNLFAATVLALVEQTSIDKQQIAAIGSHGQTVWHAPNQPHTTLQIGDPNRIAWLTGITTVADFRRMDMVAGGQGAPLAPAFHAAVFRSAEEDRVILNLGGMANITVLPTDPGQPVRGFDTGPANTLMDAWCRRHLNTAYDEAGAWAASGCVDTTLLERLLQDPYFGQTPPKSTGPEYFNLNWLEQYLKDRAANPADIQATLLQLTVSSVATAIHVHAPATASIRVCGGGADNPVMMSALSKAVAPIAVTTTDELGIPPRQVEAACFAWLARERLAGRPGNLPTVTGASTLVQLGSIYTSRPD